MAARRQTYPGVRDPHQQFEALRPALVRLRDMRGSFAPASPEYRALDHAVLALRMAANLIIGDLEFYGASGFLKRPDEG